MSLWESIEDAIFNLASAVVEGSASGFISLTRLGIALIANGALKDYGSGSPTERQLKMILAEIKRNGDSCEIKMNGKEILVKVNFRKGNDAGSR
jgi:hypothetical protein